MATNAIFKITNGTDTVDLLADATDLYGFHIESWKPAIAEYKNGGVWRDSPLAHGRRIAGKYFANVIETMTLAVHGYSADDVAYRLSDLRQLLEQASDYWIAPYSNTPVWVVARAKGETNTRYALLYAGRVTEDNNPYASPFLQPGDQATMVELPFTFERGHWASSEPGERECAPPLIPTRKSFAPTESGDDAFIEIGASKCDTSGTVFSVGKTGSNALQLGIRFKNVTIPKGAKILSANLCFEASATVSAAAVNAQIYGELTATPAIFSTYADFTGRTRTTSYATWNSMYAETTGYDYTTPDFKQVIQEIVDLDAWSSGKNLVVFMQDNGSTASAYREFATFENVSRHEPILVVTWLGESEIACSDTAYTRQNLVAQKNNLAQLAAVYWYDASITTFSENLLNGTTFPYNLLPSTVAVGDILYFVFNSNTYSRGVFDNLVLDLRDNSVDLEVDWELYAGGWSGTTVEDHTSQLTATGVRSLHFTQSASMSAISLSTLGGTNNPGIQGYAMRAVVTAVGSTNPPKAQNTHPYSVLWSHVEVPAASVPGDLPPRAQIEVRDAYTDLGDVTQAIWGIRSLARGSNFEAYLNTSDEQEPYGITVAAGTDTSFGTDLTSPTGREASCTFATVESMASRVTFTFADAIASHYLGRFRCFLIFQDVLGGGDHSVRLRFSIGSNVFLTQTTTLVYPNVGDTHYGIVDLGTINLNDLALVDQVVASYTLNVQAARNSGAVTLRMRSVVLIPTDEYAAEFYSLTGNDGINANYYLDMDSVAQKAPVRGTRKNIDGDFYSSYRAVATPMFYQKGTRQAIHFVFNHPDESPDAPKMNQDGVRMIALYKLSQYLSLRGSR